MAVKRYRVGESQEPKKQMLEKFWEYTKVHLKNKNKKSSNGPKTLASYPHYSWLDLRGGRDLGSG